MALSIEQQQSALRSEETEKGKMMRGHPFRFSDPTLMADRERCRTALSRYNNAASSADAASFQLLKQILVPSATGNGNGNGGGHGHGYAYEPVYSRGSGNGNGKDKLIGYLAPGVIVETPFKCHYGYNIKLSEDVYVGENCTIIDAFGVTIGSKTSLGPNVTIITGGPGRDLVDRQGTNSTWTGKPVVIEGEVLVGAGVVIHPGVTLGRGCTIEAGAVVMSSVDANQTVVAGEIYRRA
jgi:acetyltransferase-like isoleucine patch superfamily enzyme